MAGATGSLSLNLASAGAINIAGTGNIALNTIVSGSNGLTKTGAGAGVLTLSGANTYTGTTSVSGGTLALDFSQPGAPASNLVSSSSGLALGGGGSASTLNVIGKASTTNSQTFAGLTLNTGASSITASADATANPLLIALGGISRNIGSTVNFTARLARRMASRRASPIPAVSVRMPSSPAGPPWAKTGQRTTARTSSRLPTTTTPPRAV